jgi:hypothetical protein
MSGKEQSQQQQQHSLEVEDKSAGDMRAKKADQREQLLVAGSVAFYFTASLLLVFLNKTILSGGIKIDNATVFLTWTQILVTVVMSWVMCQVPSRRIFCWFVEMSQVGPAASRTLCTCLSRPLIHSNLFL